MLYCFLKLIPQGLMGVTTLGELWVMTFTQTAGTSDFPHIPRIETLE